MTRIKPFDALRPPAHIAPQVASVPYDVVNRDEAADLASGNPFSFLHVIRPDIDLPADTPHDSDEFFQTGVEAFKRFQREGTLQQDGQDRLYLYRLEATLLGRKCVQTGIVCCCHIDDYEKGIIKKHEKTRKDKEDERTRHVLELSANAEPVFFLYKNEKPLAELIKRDALASSPIYDFTAPDGVRHVVWAVDAPAEYVQAFKRIPAVYVADGHHRTASAARAGAERRAANPGHTGNEEYNWFLAVLFPDSELTILPYHRVVKDLNSLTPSDFLAQLGKVVKLEKTTNPEPAHPGSFGVYLSGQWHMATFPPASINHADPIASLDYVLLADRVLSPILGIGDIRTDKRIDFVGGIRGPGELKKRVDRGECAVAFCMYPTTIAQLIAVSDAGQIMPPKSTWFEPKLRSGLFVHTLD